MIACKTRRVKKEKSWSCGTFLLLYISHSGEGVAAHCPCASLCVWSMLNSKAYLLRQHSRWPPKCLPITRYWNLSSIQFVQDDTRDLLIFISNSFHLEYQHRDSMSNINYTAEFNGLPRYVIYNKREFYVCSLVKTKESCRLDQIGGFI